MGKRLAGTLFVRNAIEFDYCVEAAINSLKSFCDHLFIVDAGSNDGTYDLILSMQDEKMTIIHCIGLWETIQGREKLSYFTNIAIEKAQSEGYEYQFNLQADEVLEPDSFPYIKRAIELGEEGYIITRHNLWGSTETMLNVRQSRKPVSTQICRLTKTQYRSAGDAESVNCPASLDFINLIQIWHLGFVRDNKKHIAKIKEIQGNIFQMNVDERVNIRPEFDWKDWGFTYDDLISIPKPLPKYLDNWIKNLNK